MVAHLYHLAQQKLRYEIVKNWSRNTQKRLYFDFKIANFLQRLGAPPQTPWPPAAGSFAPDPGLGFQNFFFFGFPPLSKFLRTRLVTPLRWKSWITLRWNRGGGYLYPKGVRSTLGWSWK